MQIAIIGADECAPISQSYLGRSEWRVRMSADQATLQTTTLKVPGARLHDVLQEA
jgi:hypothetical protein